MNYNEKLKREKEKLVKEISTISLDYDLSNPTNFNKLLDLRNQLKEIESLEADSLDNKLDLIDDLNNPIEDKTKKSGHYETMSVTYIDDNGEFSEIYRINDEIVTKEAFDEWSYDYFNVIKVEKERQEQEKMKNEVIELEKTLVEKREELRKRMAQPVEKKDRLGWNANVFKVGQSSTTSFAKNMANSKFFKK